MDNETQHRESGSVRSYGPLVSFFYSMLRDHLPAGKVEVLMREIESEDWHLRGEETRYTNGDVASNAIKLAARLQTVMQAWAARLEQP